MVAHYISTQQQEGMGCISTQQQVGMDYILTLAQAVPKVAQAVDFLTVFYQCYQM